MEQLSFSSTQRYHKKYTCAFNYYFHNTSTKPAVLDGGDEIILANWLDKKSLECESSNDIPIKISDFMSIEVFFIIAG